MKDIQEKGFGDNSENTKLPPKLPRLGPQRDPIFEDDGFVLLPAAYPYGVDMPAGAPVPEAYPLMNTVLTFLVGAACLCLDQCYGED